MAYRIGHGSDDRKGVQRGKGMERRRFMASSLAAALMPFASASAQTPSATVLPGASRGTPQRAAGQNGAAGTTDANAFITFGLAINDSTMRSLMQAINIVRNYQVKDIYILIDSTGGSIEAAVDFYNFAASVDMPIHTVNMSRVCSAANYVYLAGRRRYAYPASYFLLHPGKSTSSIQGLTQQSFDDLKNGLATSEGLFKTILAEKTRLPKAELDRIFRSDVYYGPRQAQEYGIVNDLNRPVIRDADLFMICTEQEGNYWRDF